MVKFGWINYRQRGVGAPTAGPASPLVHEESSAVSLSLAKSNMAAFSLLASELLAVTV